MSSPRPGFRIEYSLDPSSLPRGERTILRILYGARTVADEAGLELALPPLGVPALGEYWSSDRIEQRGEAEGFHYVRFGARLFAWGVFDEDEAGLQSLTEAVYGQLLRLARGQGCPWLLRVWNCFPDILGAAGDLNRYQRFCAGRRQALAGADGIAGMPLPAVTTTGSAAPGFAVYFLAGQDAGRALENPRQTPPAVYPEHLGPHGPSFCRGVAHFADGQAALYLSGTASITGHETRHPGDAAAQAQEILRNHAAVIEQHQAAGATHPAHLRELAFEKVYLADPGDIPAVRATLDAALGRDASCHFLHSPLCRDDLSLEMESAWLE